MGYAPAAESPVLRFLWITNPVYGFSIDITRIMDYISIETVGRERCSIQRRCGRRLA